MRGCGSGVVHGRVAELLPTQQGPTPNSTTQQGPTPNPTRPYLRHVARTVGQRCTVVRPMYLNTICTPWPSMPHHASCHPFALSAPHPTLWHQCGPSILHTVSLYTAPPHPNCGVPTVPVPPFNRARALARRVESGGGCGGRRAGGLVGGRVVSWWLKWMSSCRRSRKERRCGAVGVVVCGWVGKRFLCSRAASG